MNNGSAKKISKKEAQILIYNKIADALSEYKKEIKPKKFKSRLKKASKLFAADIVKATARHHVTAKKPNKKVVLPKVKVSPQQEEKELAS